MRNFLLMIKSALFQQPVHNRKRKTCRENEAFIRAYQDYQEVEVKNAEENIRPSILSENATVYGYIETKGNLRLDSRIEGDLSSAGSVIIGPKGSIHGKVCARVLELYGSVYGNCTVAEVLILRCASRLNGDVQARSMLVENGAMFTGRASVGVQEEYIRVDIAGPDRINNI